MDTKQNIRKKLIERIKQLSADKLQSVESYIDQIESEIKSKQSIISFSGTFKDLDDDLQNDWIEHLHKKRADGTNRIL